MYSRSYYADDASRVALPENYDGTAFMEREPEAVADVTFVEPAQEKTVEASVESESVFSGFGKIPLLSGLFGSGGGLKLPNIGVEEILILATAAFLFFSKDGDKESAIILLLLLLIN